jgi:CubicO group peptidase (beta-lactamase class C family)
MTGFPVGGFVAPGFERVRRVFERNFIDDIEVGAACCAIVDGKTVVDLYGGYRDLECSQPWTADTLVNVYSTTKGVGAGAFACIVDAGRLSYDAPVREYWPELRAAANGLTVAQLLSHQGGLCGFRDALRVDDLYDWDGMVRRFEREEPHWLPCTGAGYHAVTWGYLAGELVRRVTGSSLGRLLSERIAEPLGADFHLGLDDRHFHRVANPISPKHARRHPTNPVAPAVGPLYPIALLNPSIRPYADVASAAWRRAEIAASNGHGTANGIARIYAMLANGGSLDGVRVLSPSTIERATRQEWGGEMDLVLGRGLRRSAGFILNSDAMFGPSDAAFGHSGAGGSTGFADPTKRLGFGYVMNQMEPGGVDDTRAARLIRAVYDAL